MACMRDIRKRSDRTDACFDPLRDTVRPACHQPARSAATEAAQELACVQVALLLRCGICLSEAVLKQLEEAPLLWKALKKKMFYRRAPPLPVPSCMHARQKCREPAAQAGVAVVPAAGRGGGDPAQERRLPAAR